MEMACTTTNLQFYRCISEDAGLIQSAQHGDLDAYNSLVMKYQDGVYQLACRILKDDDSAEDISQLVFLKAYHKLSSYYGGSFRAWLLKITTHLCLDELRRIARHPALSLDAGESGEEDYSLMDALPLESPSPEQEVIQMELKDSIKQTLRSLPLDFRLVLELVDLQEMSYAQAAEILNCPVGTIKSRLSRARVEFARRIHPLVN